MATDTNSTDTEIDYFLISTYENQLLFIALDVHQASILWPEDERN